jgi:hypothetical protein
MVLYPDAQKKAQEEIDRVIGPHRLPNFEDRQSLPYVEAVYREVQRWHPLVPFGTSSPVLVSTVMLTAYFVEGGIHTTSADDIYEGMYIPKSKYSVFFL